MAQCSECLFEGWNETYADPLPMEFADGKTRLTHVVAALSISDVEAGDILQINGKAYFVTDDGRAYHCDEEANTVGKWAGKYNLETGELTETERVELYLDTV